MIFPEWSDLGTVSTATRSSWEGEQSVRERYRYYFDGLVFQEKVPLEQGPEEDAPLLYPVGLNLVKMLAFAQTDSEFGEWEERVINFEARKDREVDEASKKAVELMTTIAENSRINTMLWEIGLDRNVYGGGAAKVTVDLKAPGFIRWDRIPLQSFYPVWDPDNIDKLIECYVVVEMTAEQARQKYGLDKGSSNTVLRVEHWTPFIYENLLDGHRIDAFSGVNPYGFVPFVFVPRVRTSHWWGDALTEDIIPVQNELNMRIADAGEAINYNSHPTRWGINLPRSFNANNFSLDGNAMWDLGRTIGNSPPPEVGLLEPKNPLPEGVFGYIKFLYDWARTSSFAPPIAFGEDNGGGQRSGLTLEIRMWPLLKAVKRSRAYLAAGLSQMMKMSALMLSQKQLSGVSSRALDRLLSGEIVPSFAPILPRDQQVLVDEVVKRMSTTPPTISLETSVEKLGDGIGEVDRIKAMLEDKTIYPDGYNKKPAPPKLPAPEKQGDAPSDQEEATAGKATPQSKKESD